jgi:hypothetical protein
MDERNDYSSLLPEGMRGLMLKQFFFDQDESCHWYRIPSDERDRWEELNRMDRSVESGREDWEDEDFYDAINDEFGHYRTGGGISQYNFYMPDNQK